MSSPRHLLLPLVTGFLATPTIIVLHELGHYAAASAIDLNPRLVYGSIISAQPPLEFEGLVVAAGPLVEAALTLCGIVWLRRSRSTIPRWGDWVATGCALASGRWLRCFTGTFSTPKPDDEAFISGLFGLPDWLLPYALAPVALAVITAAVRLHPVGMRMAPFAVYMTAGLAGVAMWFTTIGPMLLPTQ